MIYILYTVDIDCVCYSYTFCIINSIHNIYQQYTESISLVYRIYIISIHNLYHQYTEYISSVYIIYIISIQNVYQQYAYCISTVYRICLYVVYRVLMPSMFVVGSFYSTCVIHRITVKRHEHHLIWKSCLIPLFLNK
jgi:hypothetical protein